MKRALLLLIASCAWSQSGIEVPLVGMIVDPSGSLRSVQGVAGSFLLGPPMANGVLSAACSEQLCLAKTDSKILSATGQVDAPPGPAIFGFDGDQAIVFFAESRAFAWWNKDRLDPLDWTVDDEVLSMRIGDNGIEVALRRDWTGVTNGPFLLLKEGVLFATADELVLRRPDTSDMRFELTGAESISAMGPHYAAIRSGAVTFALLLDAGHEQLFVLPGNAP
jgi:hypothetical protein